MVENMLIRYRTFCRMLAGAEKPDGGEKVPPMNISMKPQKITPKFTGTVRQLFFKKIKAAFLSPQFQVIQTPLLIIRKQSSC